MKLSPNSFSLISLIYFTLESLKFYHEMKSGRGRAVRGDDGFSTQRLTARQNVQTVLTFDII